MSARPVIVIEDDPFTRLIPIVLDPQSSDARRLAFADFMAHDEPAATAAQKAEVVLIEAEHGHPSVGEMRNGGIERSGRQLKRAVEERVRGVLPLRGDLDAV